MVSLLIIKNIKAIFVNEPNGLWKWFYPFCVIVSVALMILEFNGIIKEMPISQSTMVIEAIYITILMTIRLVDKTERSYLKYENLALLLPVYLYDTMVAGFFTTLVFIYAALYTFKEKKLGETSVKIYFISFLYFLIYFKLPSSALELSVMAYLALMLLTGLVYRSQRMTGITLLTLYFFSLHYLENDIRIILGTLSVLVLLLSLHFRERLLQKVKEFRENRFFDYLLVQASTFFKSSEKNYVVLAKEKPLELYSKTNLEEKTYYTNNLRLSHSLSFLFAMLVFIMSFYFVGDIL